MNLIINLLLFIIQNICIYNYKEKKPKRTPPIRWFIASLLDKRPLEVEIKKIDEPDFLVKSLSEW